MPFADHSHGTQISSHSDHPKKFSSVQFSHSVMSDSLRPRELQHTRPPCPSPTPRVYPNSCALSRWCHPTISSSVVPFSSCPQSFLASGFFPVSQLFASGVQSTWVSASTSVLPMRSWTYSPHEALIMHWKRRGITVGRCVVKVWNTCWCLLDLLTSKIY